jgi:hypothetical protein
LIHLFGGGGGVIGTRGITVELLSFSDKIRSRGGAGALGGGGSGGLGLLGVAIDPS